tara:strand:- start:297 stop:809 length:513 start_codon:yes stop_codon:yes gene_type:complete
MERFTLETCPRIWKPIYSANTSDTGTSLIATTTQPTQNSGAVMSTNHNLAKLIFWGDNVGTAENNDLHARIYGWSKMSTLDLWIPSLICKIKIILGTSIGISAKFPDNGDHFADQIELIEGDTSVRIITDTENQIASITVDLEGADYIGVKFDTSTGTSPTTYNGAVGLF